MGVVDVVVGVEVAALDFESDLFVGIAEGSAFGCETVYFLDGVHEAVARIASYVGVDLDVGEHASGHVENGDDGVRCGEE